MSSKQVFILTLICCGILIGAAAMAQTLLTPSQIANLPHIADQRFGFSCASSGSVTTCEVDRAYILHLLPIPFNGTVTPPSPGPCSDSGGVIVSNEPAAYFCVQTVPGGPALNWIRVAGVNTW